MGSVARLGEVALDYSDLTVDPTDDCTFWHTPEYLDTDLVFGAWQTRIASFRFPGCAK